MVDTYDGFGVGTAMGVSRDEPALDIAYKLTAYAGAGRVKLSPGKRLFPSRKQVLHVEMAGRALRDWISRHGEPPAGRPLLLKAIENGRRTPAGRGDWREARARAEREVARLPRRVQEVEPARPPYPVGWSRALKQYDRRVVSRIGADGDEKR